MRHFLLDGAWLSGEPALWLVGWNFKSHTLTTKERGEELEIEFSHQQPVI